VRGALCCSGSEHDDRCATLLTDFFEHAETVTVRQHDIQNDEHDTALRRVLIASSIAIGRRRIQIISNANATAQPKLVFIAVPRSSGRTSLHCRAALGVTKRTDKNRNDYGDK
jgi:hypothetical protein